MKYSLHNLLLTALVIIPFSALAQTSNTASASGWSKKIESQSKVSKNPDLSRETRGLADSKLPNPGDTIPAPDNGPKSTMTRDAVASGQFNQTVDGSAAKGSTDPVRPNGTSAQDKHNTGIAPAISNNDIIGNNNTDSTNSNAVGTGRLNPGSTSSANISVTGSLRGPSKNDGMSANNSTDSSLRDSSTTNPSTSTQSGGATLSNSTSVSGTATPLGIAGASTSSLSSDGRSANTSSLSGSSSTGGGSLSSGSSGGSRASGL